MNMLKCILSAALFIALVLPAQAYDELKSNERLLNEILRRLVENRSLPDGAGPHENLGILHGLGKSVEEPLPDVKTGFYVMVMGFPRWLEEKLDNGAIHDVVFGENSKFRIRFESHYIRIYGSLDIKEISLTYDYLIESFAMKNGDLYGSFLNGTIDVDATLDIETWMFDLKYIKVQSLGKGVLDYKNLGLLSIVREEIIRKTLPHIETAVIEALEIP